MTKAKKKETKFNFDLRNILWRTTTGFAFGFSVAACSGFSTLNCIVSAAVFSLLNANVNGINPMIYYVVFLISDYLLNISGMIAVVIAFSVSTLISVLISRKMTLEFNENTPEFSGMFLSAALTVTCLITTYYFGIGADGNTFVQMIKSYVSLGFHPNWRGILYGTIVMVIMITFPRKFKTVSRYLKASFIALFVTLAFNLFLLPKDKPEFFALCHYDGYNYPTSDEIKMLVGIYPIAVLIVSVIAITLIFLYTSKYSETKNALLLVQTASAFTPAFPGNINGSMNEWVSGIVSALLILLSIPTEKLLERIPVASCAVVLIVGAWQSVNWSGIAKSFKSIKCASIFILTFIVCSVTPPYIGFILAAAVNFISKNTDLKKLNRKEQIADEN